MTTQENRNQQQKTYKPMDIKHTLLNNYWNIEEIRKNVENYQKQMKRKTQNNKTLKDTMNAVPRENTVALSVCMTTAKKSQINGFFLSLSSY